MTDDRAEHYLLNWGDWVRSGDDHKHELGVHISKIYGTGGINCWDDVSAATDAAAAIEADAIIDGLEMRVRMLLSNRYVTSVWTWHRGNPEQELEDAKAMFWVIAVKRGRLV